MDGPIRYPLALFLLFLCALTSVPAHAAEPSISEVREEALRYAGLDRKLDRWSRRARLRHLLPRVSATVGGLQQLDESTEFDEYLSRDSNGELLFDAAKTGNDRKDRGRLDWEIRAWIDFRGLVFDPAELQAAREARIRAGERRTLVAQVHDAYFRRRTLVEQLRQADPEERRAIASDLVRLEAELDGLTGGWFTVALRGGDR